MINNIKDKIIPDTSIFIEGILSSILKKLEITNILIHEASLAELEHQANEGKSIGFLGLEEIEKIREICKENNIQINYVGNRPKYGDIKYAHMGEIDALIRDVAYTEDAMLVTSDNVQARVARAKGISVSYIQPKSKSKKIKLEKFFDETTMSVHIKENVIPVAKKGKPGDWEFVKLSEKKIKHEEVKTIQREIIEEAKSRQDGFIEIEREGSTIVQLSNFRIVITRPPFSDGWEITAVRPVKKLSLKDYELSEKLYERVAEQAEGILIAGAPGMGKSTMAQALAEFYANQNKIVKTVEAPRDLVLPDSVTQYAISHGDPEEVHDILLLSRPDYTFFDEMRNTEDFKLFADLRLAGVGMIGVVHGTKPIDAIQRFIGRIEMGVIPQIIDTVLFIKNGRIHKVLSLSMVVKVPSGMTEADLARPMVVINDFETDKQEFEIYTYGEQTVVVPVREESKGSPTQKLASRQIEKEFLKYSKDVAVEVINDNKCIVRVNPKDISAIIGKQGKTIIEIEKRLGIGIDIQEITVKDKRSKERTVRNQKNEERNTKSKPLEFYHDINKKNIVLFIDEKYANKDINITIDGKFLISTQASKDAKIKLKKNKVGNVLIEALNLDANVKLSVK